MMNDKLIKEFYSMISEDCKKKRKSLICLNSFILPLLIEKESDPGKYDKLVKKSITPSRYIVLPNHHADIKHWSFFIVDTEIKGVFWVDTYLPSREKAEKGI